MAHLAYDPSARPTKTLAEVEKDHVVATLEACFGNKTEAARILDLDRRTLYRKLRSWGMDTKRQPVPTRVMRLTAALQRIADGTTGLEAQEIAEGALSR